MRKFQFRFCLFELLFEGTNFVRTDGADSLQGQQLVNEDALEIFLVYSLAPFQMQLQLAVRNLLQALGTRHFGLVLAQRVVSLKVLLGEAGKAYGASPRSFATVLDMALVILVGQRQLAPFFRKEAFYLQPGQKFPLLAGDIATCKTLTATRTLAVFCEIFLNAEAAVNASASLTAAGQIGQVAAQLALELLINIRLVQFKKSVWNALVQLNLVLAFPQLLAGVGFILCVDLFHPALLVPGKYWQRWSFFFSFFSVWVGEELAAGYRG